MLDHGDILYVTVAISRGREEGSIGIRLPDYQNRIIVREDSSQDNGHGRLHTALKWLLEKHAPGESAE